MSASFVYDGDGNRVKSTINGVTTTFVGSYYEVSGSTVTKYYYAGASRIAMSVNGTVSYLLSDQLGSTSITTNATGTKIAELRYGAWGDVRYTSGTTPTDYTYTGQYSNMTDFGLMYYNARWYDPVLGRMAQADSIVPGGAQGWDRYAYVRNAPARYTDPTGHWECEDAQSCEHSDSLPSQELAAEHKNHGNPTKPAATAPHSTGEEGAGPGSFLPWLPQAQEPNPLVVIAGGLLTVQLGILDAVLGYGIISVAITGVTVPGAQIGLVGELVLLPMEAASIDLTLVAHEVTVTGNTNVDPLPLVHLFLPEFMPYRP
jgi:RHS repeat-associated protein